MMLMVFDDVAFIGVGILPFLVLHWTKIDDLNVNGLMLLVFWRNDAQAILHFVAGHWNVFTFDTATRMNARKRW